MAAKLGDVVIYKPFKEDPKFHNFGHRAELAAVVVKVWDAVADLQVLPSLDLHVLQDSQTAITFVPFVKAGPNLGEYSERG